MPITNYNGTLTQNGAAVYNTTGSRVLDLFARIGGLRNTNRTEIERLYLAARAEDKELADNMILYARNIREGGIGERNIGRILIKTLALKDPAKVRRNLDTIVAAGRWDDLFVLEGTEVWTDALEFIKAQFRKDILDMGSNRSISLLAKWLPSANTSSKQTRALARKVYTYLGISERSYRKSLSALRKYLDVVEVKMSAQRFDAIDYQAVPSVAMTHYRSAFGRHDFERFDRYLKAVTKGEAKINASVTYPYELISPYIGYGRSRQADPVLEAQWKALPNYVEGNHDVVVMADVSGSMCGRPMETSVSLGIYFAERNTGAYKDMFMTFTDRPELYVLDPEATLQSRVEEVMRHVGYNTNLDGALKAVYDKAVKVGAAPEALVVISDGEIDCFMRSVGIDGLEDLIERWQRKYASAGLKAPKLIMWNVNSYGARFVSTKANLGISFVSGSSAATFKELTNLITRDAMSAMIEILTKPQFTWK